MALQVSLVVRVDARSQAPQPRVVVVVVGRDMLRGEYVDECPG